MNEKIEWYRDVLEIEPGSKVFFPLAKLYVSVNNFADAIATLQAGVLRHPEHMEARLLLIELLSLTEQHQHVQEEVLKVGTLLQTYPGFLTAWSGELAQLPKMQDAALALRFFAAALQGKHVSWASIIDHGLQALLGNTAVVTPSTPASLLALEPEKQTEHTSFVPPIIDSSADHEEQENFTFSAATQQDDIIVNNVSAIAEELSEEEEEVFSLRTRSMADVLADQGDFVGAMDIYKELIAVASGDELALLEERLQDLTNLYSSSVTVAKTDDKHSSSESNRLVELMETLAQRLEARAR